MFGELDGFVDGGMVGNPVEPEDLVKAEAQQVLQRGLLFAAIGLAQDESGAPASAFSSRSSTKGSLARRRPRIRTAICLGFWSFTTFNGAIVNP